VGGGGGGGGDSMDGCNLLAKSDDVGHITNNLFKSIGNQQHV
jgi:hypothetical protein